MKAIILAAGEGRRLRPLTLTLPKPLLEVNGMTLIERHIQRLGAVGVSSLVVNVFHLADQIEHALAATDFPSIQFSRETRLLETGGGINNALHLISESGEGSGNAPFIVVNSDIYSDYDFSCLPARLPDNILGHLVLVDNPDHHPEGDFSLAETGQLGRQGNCLTWSGISVLSPELFKEAPGGAFAIRELLFPAAKRGQLTGEHYTGFWSDVGTVERYQQLLDQFG